MQNTNFIGLAVALGSGLMIGIQSTFFTVIGRAIGPARASLVLNVVGGILAGIILITAIGLQGREHWNIPRSAPISATISVAMGLLIIMEVAAGIATLFLGQMLIGVIIDSLGGAGGETIPLDLRRVLGLIIMSIAVALLIPRQE